MWQAQEVVESVCFLGGGVFPIELVPEENGGMESCFLCLLMSPQNEHFPGLVTWHALVYRNS